MKLIKTIILSLTLMAANSSFSLSLNNNQRIPVFLAADDNYAPFVATTMASILKNTKSHIDFYVLSDGITDKNKAKIANERKWFKNFSLRFVDLDSDKLQEIFKERGHISRAAYARLFIPELDVSKNIKKAIYLDSDVIVKSDIIQLYNENLDGKIVGIVDDNYDSVRYFDHRERENNVFFKEFNIPKEHVYFNSGMLLIDMEKWRKENITEKAIKVAKDNLGNKYFTAQDQDALNLALHMKNKNLSNVYNTTVHNFGKEKDSQYLDNVIKKAVVIHYTGRKPWHDKTVFLSNEFWQIVPYTDFADEIKQIHDNSQRDTKIMKNSDKNAAKINKYVRRKVKLVYILLGILIGLNAAVLVVLVRRRKY